MGKIRTNILMWFEISVSYIYALALVFIEALYM